jgi:hypothetical protein
MTRSLASASIIAAATTLAACDKPLIKETRPTATSIGTGRVVSVNEISAQVGDDQGTRATTGFVNGGLVGMMMASEGGKAKVRVYALRMNDGRDIEVRSFSVADIGQCVGVVEMSGSLERVLERLAANDCPLAQDNATAHGG